MSVNIPLLHIKDFLTANKYRYAKTECERVLHDNLVSQKYRLMRTNVDQSTWKFDDSNDLIFVLKRYDESEFLRKMLYQQMMHLRNLSN
ncbi:hypothetical protein D5E87_21780 [Vibrio parahaemolyticus]|nr:hypothetical protein BUN10_22525 [Vibrio parahaemolyticus]TBT02651.1 hypothetical protein D5E87_21780 [Vibrio parahaemolyticus]